MAQLGYLAQCFGVRERCLGSLQIINLAVCVAHTGRFAHMAPGKHLVITGASICLQHALELEIWLCEWIPWRFGVYANHAAVAAGEPVWRSWCT